MPQAGGASPVRALRCHLRLWPLAAVGLAIDLWSKNWAFKHLHPEEPTTIIPHLLSLRRSVNPGALFGMGQGLAPVFIGASVLALLFVLYLFAHSTRDRRILHMSLGLILAGALGNLYDRSFHLADAVWCPPAPDRWWEAAFGDKVYITGKLVGEDEDTWSVGPYPDGEGPARRVRKEQGFYLQPAPIVRDFVKLEPKLGRLELWPWIFNVADMLLVFGVCGLLTNFWIERRAARRAASRDDPAMP